MRNNYYKTFSSLNRDSNAGLLLIQYSLSYFQLKQHSLESSFISYTPKVDNYHLEGPDYRHSAVNRKGELIKKNPSTCQDW